MIKKSEITLTLLETNLTHPDMKLFTNDQSISSTKNILFSTWTYGRCFRCAFCIVGYSSFMIGIISFSLALLK